MEEKVTYIRVARKQKEQPEGTRGGAAGKKPRKEQLARTREGT